MADHEHVGRRADLVAGGGYVAVNAAVAVFRVDGVDAKTRQPRHEQRVARRQPIDGIGQHTGYSVRGRPMRRQLAGLAVHFEGGHPIDTVGDQVLGIAGAQRDTDDGVLVLRDYRIDPLADQGSSR